MRIAIIHSFYASAVPSGENETVVDQAEALRRAGHHVEIVSARTDDLTVRPLYPLRAAATVATGRGRSPVADLRRFRPDVVHVHNLFPNFGRVWTRNWPGPLVATLHNFRPLCAAASLYRDGVDCTRCPDGDRFAGLRRGCYRDSRVATAPLAWAGRRGAAGDPLLTGADRLIVLSELSRAAYMRAGVAAERMALIPNFVAAAPYASPRRQGRGPWMYVGRLSPEKGVLDLLHRWPADIELEIAGDGELMAACRAAAPPGVRFLGALPRTEVRTLLAAARGLVFPSRWREGAPLVHVEALAAGVPVLAFAGSGAADSVRERGTGAVITWDHDLPAELRRAAVAFPRMREHCRRVFAEHFTESVWTARMTELYSSLIRAAAARPARPPRHADAPEA